MLNFVQVQGKRPPVLFLFAKVNINNEIAYMKTRHDNILENGDPYYNPNLTLESEDFGL